MTVKSLLKQSFACANDMQVPSASRLRWIWIGLFALVAQPNGAFAQEITFPEPTDTAGNRPQPAYDPTGIRLGSFIAYPRLGISSAFDSNVLTRSENAVSDFSVTAIPSIRIAKEEAAQTIVFDASMRLRRYAKLSRQNDEQYQVGGRGRFELSSRTLINVNANWARSTASRGTFENNLQIGDPLRVDRLTGVINVQQRFNRLTLTGQLSGERFRYNDVRLDDGSRIDQSFRDGHRIGATLRASYSLSPKFALVAIGRVENFDYRDAELENRDATNTSFTIGGSYEITRLLYIELGAGLRKHDFKRTDFASTSGLALNGRLRWYPTPLLSVRFDLSQDNSTAVLDTVSTVTLTTGRLAADYELKRNLILSAEIEGSRERYAGLGISSKYMNISTQANWKANRWLNVIGRLDYDRRFGSDSQTIPEFDAFRAMLTLTLAR